MPLLDPDAIKRAIGNGVMVDIDEFVAALGASIPEGGGGGPAAYGDLTGIPAAIDAIDGLTPAADRVAYYTGASTAALATFTGFARSLVDDADAATARGTLGAAASAVTLTAGTGLTGGGDLTANRSFALTGQALSVHNLASNGIIARTAADTVAARTLTGTARISVTNGDGVAGNPTLDIAQNGATTGQVLKWNGTVWAPANDDTGASAGYASQRTITTSGNITDADRNGVVYINGSGITATFVRTGFSARDRVLLINIGTASATISAGTDGFNTAGNDSFTLFPGEEREVVYEGSADPFWRVAIPTTVSLAANQVATLNNAGTAFEARTEKVVASIFLPITGNVSAGAAEGQIGMWGNKPTTLTAVRARTLAGTCDIQIRKAGTAINGFGTAVAQTTSVTGTASTEAFAQDNLLDVVVTSASSLTGLFITFLGVRTAD